eukprot:TRINITY_DN1703_c0_g1_i14.p1 TRINITY_DN1703_c0_g1~~TRINITY_DN1703_c0_g1_i14.p1  ORF type:complete len:118 (-),score=37.12 TRINITY_DN1703_c0_g1_i14:39-392(-)
MCIRDRYNRDYQTVNQHNLRATLAAIEGSIAIKDDLVSTLKAGELFGKQYNHKIKDMVYFVNDLQRLFGETELVAQLKQLFNEKYPESTVFRAQTEQDIDEDKKICLLYTSPSPRDS